MFFENPFAFPIEVHQAGVQKIKKIILDLFYTSLDSHMKTDDQVFKNLDFHGSEILGQAKNILLVLAGSGWLALAGPLAL